MNEIKKKRNAVFFIGAELVFIAKSGQDISANLDNLRRIVSDTMIGYDGELVSIGVSANLLVFRILYPPKYAISTLVNVLKSKTGRKLQIGWSRKYFTQSICPAKDYMQDFIKEMTHEAE